MLRRSPALLAALAATAAAAAVPTAASAAAGVKIGHDAELRYGALDFQFDNSGPDVSGKLKVTAHGKVVAKGETLSVDRESSDWGGVKLTKYGESLAMTGSFKARVTGTMGRHIDQAITVYSGTKKWNGVYKATNGLEFKVKNGFGYELSYATLAYCTRSATSQNAFYSLPYDQLPVIVKGNGSFATKGHIDTGMIVKFTGKISPKHKVKGYASWSWYNIFAGPDPGDFDYCATGGKFHGKRVSTKVRKD